MKVKLSKISIHQSSKVLALAQGLVFALFLIPMATYSFVTGDILSGIFVLLGLLLCIIVWYVGFALSFWIYNLIASSFGGVEFTLSEQKQEPVVPSGE